MPVPGFEQSVPQGDDALSMAITMLGEANARAEQAERQRNLLLTLARTALAREGMDCLLLSDGSLVVEPAS